MSVLQWLIYSHGPFSDLGHFTLQERVCSAIYSRSHNKLLAETGREPGTATCQLSWPSKWHSCETWGYILYQPEQQEMLCHAGGGISQPSCPPVKFQMQSPSLSTGHHHRWPSVFGSQPRRCQSIASVLAVERDICNLPLILMLINRLQCDHLPMFPAASLVWSASSKRDYFFLYGFA